ncbi:MAG TPA: SDR family NAD(P)-dependent oxidoreductase [Dehalococcoidia bacterium]|nr:SDR family NAD(P)-dependent oxidoreductase [Dehalococcoidia bacterium]
MGRLNSKVALVTGAASGIGRESAITFAREGAAVMCADIDMAGAEATAAAVSEHGGTAEALELDVANGKAVSAALRQTATEFGGIDVLFNNAGIGGAGFGWDRVIEVNLGGVYNGLYYGCQVLSERGGGSVVSTASIAGLVALPAAPMPDAPPTEYGSGAYHASKAGVIQLTRQFAVQFARKGVRVNAIAPGFIVTPMTAAVREDPAGEKHLADLHPMGRLGEPAEIATVAAFLASDEASFITGATLPVDGGYTAR